AQESGFCRLRARFRRLRRGGGENRRFRRRLRCGGTVGPAGDRPSQGRHRGIDADHVAHGHPREGAGGATELKQAEGLMLALTLALGAIALLLFFYLVPKLAAARGVGERHFERNLRYTATCQGTEAEQRAAAEANPLCLQAYARFKPAEARGYASPVLFPYDVVMMIFLAAFLAVGAVTFAAHIPWLAGRVGLIVALPIAYFIADFLEDALLAWLLTHPDAVSIPRVTVLKSFTVAKFATLGAASLQW